MQALTRVLLHGSVDLKWKAAVLYMHHISGFGEDGNV